MFIFINSRTRFILLDTIIHLISLPTYNTIPFIIIFIKKIVPGGVNDSYGIDVAKLAGLPDKVIRRAKDILQELESRDPAQPVPAALAAAGEDQFDLAALGGLEVVERLKKLQPDTLTPIEALSLLYELTAKAKEC